MGKFERIFVIGFLSVVALIVLVPFLFLLINTIKPPGEAVTTPLSLPSDYTIGAYRDVWPYMGTALLNSLKVTGGSVALLIFLTPMISYTLSFEEFRGKRVVTLLSLFGIFAIPVAGLVPLLLTLKNFGLLNSHIGLILVYFGLYYPTSVFIIREFYKSTSYSLWEAAELDGLSFWMKYKRIYFPMAKPMLITLTILMTVFVWNEYTLALVLLQDSSQYTVPLMLAALGGEYGVPWALRLAGIAISAIPMILIVVFFSDKLRTGMSFGTIK